jgi:hypothetical protein
MKNRIPSPDELIDRFTKCIQLQHPDVPITKNGKNLLKETWRGKEQRLYVKVKQMENEEIKFQNLKKRIDHRIMETQFSVDILGFPIYITHENVFQTDIDRQYRKGASNQILVHSETYFTKQH